jgi:hypothetical protein
MDRRLKHEVGSKVLHLDNDVNKHKNDYGPADCAYMMENEDESFEERNALPRTNLIINDEDLFKNVHAFENEMFTSARYPPDRAVAKADLEE